MIATAKQVEIKERPIIFSGPMVKAILEGRKTQTRRVVSFPVTRQEIGGRVEGGADAFKGTPTGRGLYITLADNGIVFDTQSGRPSKALQDKILTCPYGDKGDRLWVRETWQPIRRNSPEQDAKIKASLDRLERGEVKDIVAEVQGWPFPPNGDREVLYAADFGDWAYDVDSDLKPWKSPLFLPRNLSRITLEVTNVRAERLQEISRADAQAEGILCSCCKGYHSRQCVCVDLFGEGWDSLNAKRGYSWASNPFVWVIEFRKL